MCLYIYIHTLYIIYVILVQKKHFFIFLFSIGEGTSAFQQGRYSAIDCRVSIVWNWFSLETVRANFTKRDGDRRSTCPNHWSKNFSIWKSCGSAWSSPRTAVLRHLRGRGTRATIQRNLISSACIRDWSFRSSPTPNDHRLDSDSAVNTTIATFNFSPAKTKNQIRWGSKK